MSICVSTFFLNLITNIHKGFLESSYSEQKGTAKKKKNSNLRPFDQSLGSGSGWELFSTPSYYLHFSEPLLFYCQLQLSLILFVKIIFYLYFMTKPQNSKNEKPSPMSMSTCLPSTTLPLPKNWYLGSTTPTMPNPTAMCPAIKQCQPTVLNCNKTEVNVMGAMLHFKRKGTWEGSSRKDWWLQTEHTAVIVGCRWQEWTVEKMAK